MFQAPINNIVVTITTKYIKNISDLMRRASLENGASVDPSDFVNTIGDVVSVPKEISSRRDYQGYSVEDIKPGDLAIFGYQVIYNFATTSPDAEPIYKNLVTYRAKEFWLCDVLNLFAVVRDNKIRMQNGYVMLEEMAPAPKIILHQNIKQSLSTTSALVSHIGKPLTHQKRIAAEVGDRVFFNPNKIQVYQTNGRPFGIIQQQHILGHTVPDYKDLAHS